MLSGQKRKQQQRQQQQRELLQLQHRHVREEAGAADVPRHVHACPRLHPAWRVRLHGPRGRLQIGESNHRLIVPRLET